MKRKDYLTFPAVVAVSLLTGCLTPDNGQGGSYYSAEELEPKIADITITEVDQMTGQDSINQTEELYDVAGTDLGSMFDLDGTFYYVFGDTFGAGSTLPPEGLTTNWRSNVVAYSTDTDPTDGIEFDGFFESNGVAKEIIPSNKIDGDHLTSIPTYGVAVNRTMYLYYMAVDSWGAPGEWYASYSGVYHSMDKGETWEPVKGLEWDGDSNFIQMAIVNPKQNEEVLGEDIYFYGVSAGRYSPIQLMKVNKNDIEDKSKYLYFTGVDTDGVPKWSENESDAETILDVTAGELSVVWNEELDRWIMTYINGTTTDIDLVEAENPWGPWTEPKVMIAQNDFPGLYGSYMHPTFIENEGKTIYFTMSRWDDYNTFMMKADFKLN